MPRPTLILLLLLAGLILPRADATDAPKPERKPVKTATTWTGSLTDAAKAKGLPQAATGPKGFLKIWQQLKGNAAVPDVDFTKEVVVTATSVGSRLILSAALDSEGDLQVGGVATKDIRPGLRYVIATVPKEGVKTINGQPLPEGDGVVAAKP